jgi:adhesin/invasin
MTRAALVMLLAAIACAAGAERPAVAATRACPSSNAPNTMTLAGGSPQTAQLGMPFAQPLQVTLANTNGCPVTTQVAGVPVTFSAPGSAASGTFAASGSNAVTVGTDSSGAASAQFTANGVTGYYTVVASSEYGTVTFSLTNTASGLPYTIAAVAPATSSATVDARYAQPLSVVVRDANGNPVAGTTVTFAFDPGANGAGATFDGGVMQATTVTDASGTATSPRFSANATPGRFVAAASVSGVVEPTEFSLDNLPGKGSSIAGLLPVTQKTVVGTRFAKRLEVKVRDADRVPIPGATVTFAIGGTAGAAGATFAGGAAQATATTNAGGVAVSPRLTADTVAGTFSVTATATGVTRGAVFSLRNVAGRPASVVAGVAGGEQTAVGTRFPIRLAVTVTDRYGNAVRGAVVRFVAPASGPSARFRGSRSMRSHTDAAGVAIAPPLVANRRAGGYVVRASTGGHVAAFALVNEPGA